MTKFSRTSAGKYSVNGKTFEMLIGTRAQVWHGTSYKTSGGLTHNNLMKNKAGRIVSKSKHETAKKDRRLAKAGYVPKKGQFKLFHRSSRSSKRGGSSHNVKMNHAAQNVTHSANVSQMKHKGGKSMKNYMGGSGMSQLNPSNYNGKGEGTSGVALQFIAGNAG